MKVFQVSLSFKAQKISHQEPGTINRSIPSILPLLGQTRLFSQICQIVLKSMEMDREWMKRTSVYKQFIQEDVHAIAMQSHNETVFWSNHPFEKKIAGYYNFMFWHQSTLPSAHQNMQIHVGLLYWTPTFAEDMITSQHVVAAFRKKQEVGPCG